MSVFAISLRFRLSIQFTSESFVCNRTMSLWRISPQSRFNPDHAEKSAQCNYSGGRHRQPPLGPSVGRHYRQQDNCQGQRPVEGSDSVEYRQQHLHRVRNQHLQPHEDKTRDYDPPCQVGLALRKDHGDYFTLRQEAKKRLHSTPRMGLRVIDLSIVSIVSVQIAS